MPSIYGEIMEDKKVLEEIDSKLEELKNKEQTPEVKEQIKKLKKDREATREAMEEMMYGGGFSR